MPGTGGGANIPACLYITDNTGSALHYTAELGTTILTNGNTTTGSGRVLRIGGDSSATGALHITGGELETRGVAGDLIGNTANSYGRVVVDGGKWVSSTNATMLFGNSGVRAEFIVNSGTAIVGVVQAVNSSVGLIELNSGLLQPARLERTGTMALTVNLNGGTLRAQTDQTAWLASNGVTYNVNGAVTIETFGQTVGIASNLGGTGALTKAGTGTLSLNGANSYDGVTTISSGTVRVNHHHGLGSAAGGTVIGAAGAMVSLGNGVTVAGEAITLLGNGDNFGALQAAANSTSVWNGPVFLASDAGTASPRIGAGANGVLTVAGPIADGAAGTHVFFSPNASGGRVILTATNTYSGNTGIIRGTLQLGVDGTLPAGSLLTLNAGNIDGDSSAFDTAGFQQTLTGLASGSGSQPCLVTNSAAGLSTLTLNQSADTTYGGTIGGNLALVKNGVGSMTLTNVNTFSGGVTMNNGTLVAMSSNGLGSGPVTVTGGALVLRTTNAAPGGISFTAANNTAALGAAYALDQAFLNWAAANVTGTVTVLTSGKTYTGPTTVRSGSLHILADSSLGMAPATPTPGHLTINGGRLYSATSSDISLSGNRGIAVGTNGAIIGAENILRIPGAIADVPGEAGVVTLFGAGIVVFSGTNTYSGGTFIPTGTRLVILGNQALGLGPVRLTGGTIRAAATAPAITYVSNAALVEVGSILGESNAKNVTYLGPVTLVGGSRTLTLNGTDTATLAGPVGDGGLGYGLTKAGVSILTLSGTNTYTGPTIVTGGTLALAGHGTVSNSSLIQIGAGANLQRDRAGGRRDAAGRRTDAAGQRHLCRRPDHRRQLHPRPRPQPGHPHRQRRARDVHRLRLLGGAERNDGGVPVRPAQYERQFAVAAVAHPPREPRVHPRPVG